MMDIANYTTLTRQTGLMREMNVIANNIANAPTTGYRQQSLLFSEFLSPIGTDAVSMANANVSRTDLHQGSVVATGNTLDLTIQGDGFFMVETPDGTELTRNGNFTVSPENMVVTSDGLPVLGVAGAPILVPGANTDLAIGQDGTLSVSGAILGQFAVVIPDDPKNLIRQDGVRFRLDGDAIPASRPSVVQGFLEQSNTDPIAQMARLIDVQRAYEMAQSFLEAEDKRVRSVTQNILK